MKNKIISVYEYSLLKAGSVMAICSMMLYAVPCQSSQSYGTAFTIEDNTLRFGYGVVHDSTPFPGVVSCTTPNCYFGPIPRTGLGPSGSLCDSGGTCNVSPGNVGRTEMISVKNGTSMQDAYLKFCDEKGCFGDGASTSAVFQDVNNPDIAWGALCVGFAVLPDTVSAVSVPASNTTCGVITPPNVTCRSHLPGEVDLGIVYPGSVHLEQSIKGVSTCTSDAVISAAILKIPYLQKNKVSIFINDTELDSASKVVGKGKNVMLNARFVVDGVFEQAGNYNDDAVIVFSYL